MTPECEARVVHGRDYIMYYVYLLIGEKDKKPYVGFTRNLKERIKKHNSGSVISTKYKGHPTLVFYEAYINKEDAQRRETYFKTTKGKVTLKQMLKSYYDQNK